MGKKKTRKQIMRDLTREVKAEVNRGEKAYRRLVDGDYRTIKRKARQTVKSVPATPESPGHKGGDLGANPGPDDRPQEENT